MKFRKKPIVIEAFHLTRQPAPDWFHEALRDGRATLSDDRGLTVFIPTLEGTMRADKDDWIIKGVKGELYPCKPDIFEASYERVE